MQPTSHNVLLEWCFEYLASFRHILNMFYLHKSLTVVRTSIVAINAAAMTYPYAAFELLPCCRDPDMRSARGVGVEKQEPPADTNCCE